MTYHTEVPTPVTVCLSISPQQWDAVCVLSARGGILPEQWLLDAVSDCIDAGIEALPPVARLPVAGSASAARWLEDKA